MAGKFICVEGHVKSNSGDCDQCGEPLLPVTYPPKVVRLSDIEKFMPWAATETADDGELVIYTGLREIEDAEYPDQPLAFIDGMDS